MWVKKNKLKCDESICSFVNVILLLMFLCRFQHDRRCHVFADLDPLHQLHLPLELAVAPPHPGLLDAHPAEVRVPRPGAGAGVPGPAPDRRGQDRPVGRQPGHLPGIQVRQSLRGGLRASKLRELDARVRGRDREDQLRAQNERPGAEGAEGGADTEADECVHGVGQGGEEEAGGREPGPAQRGPEQNAG